MSIAEQTWTTPEALASIPDEKGFELIDGELSERKVSAISSLVAIDLALSLGWHIKKNQLGWLFGSDNGFQCFPDRPSTVRRPDLSFVKAGRLTVDQLSQGWLKVVPDLVVEVISHNDTVYEMDEKIEMFVKVGVPLIWIVNPIVRTVRVIRLDGSTATFRDGDELSGEAIIPGFSCPVASIFPPRAPDEVVAPA